MTKKIRFIILLLFGLIILMSNNSNATNGLNLKNLNYDVKISEDGSMDVTEKWNIEIEDTNTLFKTFEIDKNKYKEITNVSVYEIDNNGERKPFEKIEEEKYHVDKNCFYSLINKDGKFEIAWGVDIQDDTKTYEIEYKVVDSIHKYNDCSELYWQFISEESEIPADNITGTIKLPKAVEKKENLKVWAHGPLNGNIQIYSNDIIKFEVEKFRTNTMLEVRVVTTDKILNMNNTINENKLQQILDEEQRWADEANAQRERNEMIQKTIKIILIVLEVIGLLLGIYLIKIIFKYKKILKNNPRLTPQIEIEYYRDIPEENYTPSIAAFIYYFNDLGMKNNMPKIISATMLELCIKKYLSFEIIDDKKNKIRIVLNNQKDIENLTEDEREIYIILRKVADKNSNSFTMKDFEEYAKLHNTELLEIFNKLENIAKNIGEKQGIYDKELIKEADNWLGKGILYIFLIIVGILCMKLVILPAIIISVYCFKIYGRFNRLTQKGINEKAKLVGLKKYMENFSMMQEKSVPELILWEKYLVYATVFGIADKVLKQLKVVYPQIADSEYMRNHGYTYMYIMYNTNINNNLISSLNKSINETYNSVYSSGSGAGGGFSSGGGGRRWRRPEWEEDKRRTHLGSSFILLSILHLIM